MVKFGKMMSSLLCGTLLTSVVASQGVFAAAKSSGSADQITLQFWTINLKKNFSGYFNDLINSYQKLHPNVKINWVDVPGADIDQKLIASLASGDVPDVVNETNLGLTVIPGDAVYPMSDLVNKSKLNVYIPGLLQGVSQGGKVMALPWYNGGPPVGIINTALYKQAGLDPSKPPKTWADLFSNGKRIHAKLSHVYGSNDIPALEGLTGEGIPILSKDKKSAAFDTPKAVAYVQKFVQAYKDGAIAPGAITKDDRNLPQTVDNGLAAQSGQFEAFKLNDWEQNAPKIIPKLKAIPAVTDTRKLAIKDIQLFIVPKKSKHPKEAADFALYVTNPANQLKFCKLVAIFPSTSATLKDPFFTNIQVKSIDDQVRKLMVQESPNMVLDDWGVKQQKDLRDYFDEQMRAALLGNETAKQALSTAASYWNSKLASN